MSFGSPIDSPTLASETPNILDPLDAALARWMSERDPEHAEAIRATVLLLSTARRDGHTAIQLSDVEQSDLPAKLAEAEIAVPPLNTLHNALERSHLVGAPGELTPLILDGDLLFFRRFNEGERRIREAVQGRLDALVDVDVVRLRSRFEQLFEPEIEGDVNWQAVAAAAALRSRFLCIAGGPGTGKTTTVIRLMALLLEHEPELRVALAAPTGKAANRMAESISNQVETLHVDANLKERIPTSAATLHRLLGYRPSQARFIYGEDRRLETDVVIVDEASMIDHELFTSLLEALDKDTRLILIGDPNQLPSVDAGFVFGDLCRLGEGETKGEAFVGILRELGLSRLPPSEATIPPLRDTVVTLQHGFRFGPESGIGHLAYALRDGRTNDIHRILAPDAYSDLRLVPHDEQKRVVRRAVREYAKALIDAASPREALKALDRLRILSPVRLGERGVEALNEDLEAWLYEVGVRPRGNDYAGKPLLITTNDYDVGLFNGDVGVLWKKPDGGFVGCFPDRGEIREVALNRLPPHEVAWAMTVHKSQGSEFDDVVLVLPEQENSGHLTRELLYTAVTRARNSVTIVGDESLMIEAASRQEIRTTGLSISFPG